MSRRCGLLTLEKPRTPMSSLRALVALALMMFALGACTVRLIGTYDEAIDQGVTELQKDVETFLISMQDAAGTPEGKFAPNKGFYVRAKAHVGSLRIRADAIPKNEITSAQLGEVRKNLDAIEKLHKLNDQLSEDDVTAIRSAMNMQFGAILKLELAKKRGDA
jgi:hypothetical protein